MANLSTRPPLRTAPLRTAPLRDDIVIPHVYVVILAINNDDAHDADDEEEEEEDGLLPFFYICIRTSRSQFFS